jgi:hypothetical protein
MLLPEDAHPRLRRAGRALLSCGAQDLEERARAQAALWHTLTSALPTLDALLLRLAKSLLV